MDDERDRPADEGTPEAESRNGPQSAGSSSEEQTLPPADFHRLVSLLSTQAMLTLGTVPNPSGEYVPQPRTARHFIDLLAVLQEKTAGNLDQAEQRLLDDSLAQLQMAWLQVTSNSQA